MTLRARLLIVIVVLLATYAATAYVMVTNQRALLIDQIDQRLRALPPNALTGLVVPAPVAPMDEPVITRLDQRESPFSELHIGVVDAAGVTTTLIESSLPTGLPNFAAAVDATGGGEGIVTVRGSEGAAAFRAYVAPQPGANAWIVAAQSLKETEAAVERLTRMLWVAGVVIAVVLAMAFVWVQRLGLRPIGRVTAAAEAIAAGDRRHRVDVDNPGTEAGKLGHAFNVMLDERDASDARLRQFVADASHELRTPLTSVRGYLELVRQGAFEDRAHMDDVVRRLSAETARMNRLVEDLLALASLEEGRPLCAETVDLGQVLCDAGQDAQAVQPGRAITLDVPNRGPIVTGDAGLITQLVSILVSNALAHSPVSAPIRLTAGQQGPEVVVAVADEGPGLDPDAAQHVFDRFWRGETSRVRSDEQGRIGGAGLGLAIAKSIAEAHGGEISLKTAPGQGAIFTVRLPFAPNRD